MINIGREIKERMQQQQPSLRYIRRPMLFSLESKMALEDGRFYEFFESLS